MRFKIWSLALGLAGPQHNDVLALLCSIVVSLISRRPWLKAFATAFGQKGYQVLHGGIIGAGR
jgi:hypothetical protein